MDLQKEREAFEAVMNTYHCIYNADLNYYFSGSKFVGNKAEIEVNAGWKAWQAAIARMEVRINTLDEMLLNQGEALAQAKAQAVPDLSELQERIAGHQYYHDEHDHMIVDMDDVVKEISGFDSWKSQAVPEWIETAIQPPEEGQKVIISGIYGVGIAEFSYLYKDEFVMYDTGASNPILSKDQVKFWMPLPDAPQESAND